MNYTELHAASAFSFLDGASLPEDLVAAAADAGLSSVALVDTNGVYGAPRFYRAAREAGMRPLVGAEVMLDPSLDPDRPGASAPALLGWGGEWPTGKKPRGFRGLSREEKAAVLDTRPRLTLLVGSRAGYRNLCRLLTAGALSREKGDACATWDMIAENADGLACLTGGDEGPLAAVFRRAMDRGEDPLPGARRLLERLTALFPGRVHVELQRHHRRDEEHRNRALVDLARQLKLPLVATNGVRHARADDKELLDVLTCIRLGLSLDTALARLLANRERHVKSAAEMRALFRDLPEAIEGAASLGASLEFTLADLGYRFPEFPLPDGETAISHLRKLTWAGASERFRPLHEAARRQIEKELGVIEKLDLAGYFLIVWDIVRFCREQKIMAQGRGSAANSAVCYALSITAVDPIKMDLLFERFLSEERGEWPDIDLDLPSGDQRERVIQYLYTKYGAHSAAMTANVITYRPRSAIRDVAKAFGHSLEQVDKLSSELGSLEFGEMRDRPKLIAQRLLSAGLDPREPRVRRMVRSWLKIQNLPRHLGQHSGGMVIAAGRLDGVVPLEPASMEGRVVIQWDKDDCADLGIVKVDLLGLGMLQAIEEALPMIRDNEGVAVDLAHLPPDDPVVFAQLNRADTIGVFQLESRAQMASLPRHKPYCFYDIVVQVAIIRPGPIVGGMIHPFFRRRAGKEPVDYPHPSLEPVLKRTLGVPLFQEQVIRMAMVAAGFTGGEAEELRRAIGFKRSVERMAAIEARLRRRMEERGVVGKKQDDIVQMITSFALYGFPESHAASFALIAYASAYLKAHHPAAFYASLLNAWPMGFYHPATLVKDAQRHGVSVRPIDVNRSDWRCRWEAAPGAKPRDAEGRFPSEWERLRAQGIRIGLRYVKGLSAAAGERIESARRDAPFQNADDLARRAALGAEDLSKLAHAGALAAFGLARRDALWQAARAARSDGPLFAGTREADGPSPLPAMSAAEETEADYLTTDLTVGPHLLHHLRPSLRARGVLSASELDGRRDGSRVRLAGSVIVRQRPGTAKGFVFLTLEDETGMCQAIVNPALYERARSLIVGSPVLLVEGPLQKSAGSPSIKAERFERIDAGAGVPSHDFH